MLLIYGIQPMLAEVWNGQLGCGYMEWHILRNGDYRRKCTSEYVAAGQHFQKYSVLICDKIMSISVNSSMVTNRVLVFLNGDHINLCRLWFFWFDVSEPMINHFPAAKGIRGL